jgi:outer membrane lipoprotein carrier protein
MRAPARFRALALALVPAFAFSFVLALPLAARADPVQTLRSFVRDVKSGHSAFTQTVTSPDGVKKKTSSGTFDFSRPNRFRFVYQKPFEQIIVGDGEKVWIYDADLNQVSSRKLGQALGATPAALLAGGSIEHDFDLADLPAQDGLDWVEAKPKAKDGAFQSVRVGFRGDELAALEIIDSFGQKSLLQFNGFVANAPVAADLFRFKVPPGADVIEQ